MGSPTTPLYATIPRRFPLIKPIEGVLKRNLRRDSVEGGSWGTHDSGLPTFEVQ